MTRSPSALALFLDFDGTLAEIVERPEDACARPGALRALAALVARGVRTAVVSGRALDDLASRVPVPGAWLVGVHGGELRAPDGHRRQLVDPRPSRPFLEAFLEEAREVARPFSLIVEDKRLAVAVHLRSLPPEVAQQVEARLLGLAERLSRAGEVSVVRGNAVVELRADGATKANAVRTILGEWGGTRSLVAVGDDATDEEMFLEVLRAGGLAIKVGRGDTIAPRRLGGPGAVERWLVGLAGARRRKRSG